jgi:pimeloyl-ACP methyl ester carboxylesterase
MSLASLALTLSLIGWADAITVTPSRGDRVHASWQRTIAAMDRPGERTIETLKRFDLEGMYRTNPDGAISRLERRARAQTDPDLVFALAELSWVEGRKLDRRRKPGALDRYLDTVAYAYDFLFDPDMADGRSPSDPRYRMACDFYNAGLDRLIRAAKSSGKISPNEDVKLKVNGKEQTIKVVLETSPWTKADLNELLLASDFEVAGLPSRAFLYGVGVPLIGVRKSDPVAREHEQFYPPEMAFPLTAIIQPNSRLRDTDESEVEELRECTLKLVDPLVYRTFGVESSKLVVESDLTTPLAYMWSRTDLAKFRWAGLLKPGESLERTGLMLLRPYEAGKIPVVMVHGLASSPLAWIPMINELLRDPRINERFQFLLYVYPTGLPMPIAMASLRESLQGAQATFNRDGSDAAFNKMVLLGHSMGGLLSHAMVVNSDDRFWRLDSDRAFDEIFGPAEVRAELKRYLFFEPLPFVRRVVFLATPHRGSDLAVRMVGRLSTSLISDPDHITALLARLNKENPDAFDRKNFQRMPTSIETLSPRAKVLPALLAMKPGPDVKFHSIIGSNRPGPKDASTDGVVPYASAYIKVADSKRVAESELVVDSELVVRSDHAVQKDPIAIGEVHRILLEHIGLTPNRQGATAKIAEKNLSR